mgnify:CR=1 FL=1
MHAFIFAGMEVLIYEQIFRYIRAANLYSRGFAGRKSDKIFLKMSNMGETYLEQAILAYIYQPLRISTRLKTSSVQWLH